MGTQDTTGSESEETGVNPGGIDSETEGKLSPAVVSDLLSNRRRRYLLYYLEGCDYAASVQEITEQIAVWETETRADAIAEEVYERVQTELIHLHLPKLVEAEAVDYDEDSGVVALADGTDRLSEELFSAAQREPSAR